MMPKFPKTAAATVEPMSGDELSQALDALKMRQIWLAHYAGVSQMSVSRWCRGRARVPGPVAALVREMLRAQHLDATGP